MDAQLLEKILRCPNLPSLPAVAVQVVELTGRKDASLEDLARTIQNDQGLATRILKTVNSSFYGLRTRCATIQRALVLLGLGPVKSLALGFSLVQAVGHEGDFDYQSYWRRGLFSAAAAKKVADAAGLGHLGDEAFLGGLLQDIGMLAMYRALGRGYLDIIAQAEGDHRRLVRCELALLDIQHPEIGAMLAARWKLPDDLVLPVRYHERPTACPPKCTDLVRAVGLGNLVHDVLTDADPGPALRCAYHKAREWFKLAPERVDELIKAVGAAAKELSSLFSVHTGPAVDAEAVLARAGRRIDELSRLDPHAASLAHDADCLTVEVTHKDPLTGVFNRSGFDSVARSAFYIARTKSEPLTLVLVALDRFNEICHEGPEEIDGEIAMGVSAMLKRQFDSVGGVVGRLGPDLFGVVIQGAGRSAVAAIADTFRAELEDHSQQWAIPDYPGRLRVTASVGLTSFEPSTGGFEAPDQLVAAGLRAAQAARTSGGNTVRAFVPRVAA